MNSPVNPPRQKRSRHSFEQLMKAGIEILREGAEAEFSIADLSRRTGVSVGSIYQRFGSKERIYLALQDRVLSELDGEVEQLFAPNNARAAPFESVVADAVRRFCGHLRRNEALLRALITRDVGNAAALARGELSSQRIEAALLDFLAASLVEMRNTEVRASARVGFRVLYSSAWSRLMKQPLALAEPEYSWEGFTETMTEFYSAYLSTVCGMDVGMTSSKLQ